MIAPIYRRRRAAGLVCAIGLAFVAAVAAATSADAQNPRVRIETDAGNITVEVYSDKAPVTASNFMSYVTAKAYDGGAFYRVVTMQNQPTSPVKIEVIQGGLDSDSSKRMKPIAHETNDKTGVKHVDGTISMARSTPGSATSEFFFCVGAQPELDFGGKRNPDGQGFAAFGKVIEGMDVVRKIQRMPSDSAPPQRLKTLVRIKSIRAL
jgi:peptidyl-prolyl cis-trans isomerase A (cyclophilin A)